jgi:DNA-binding NtrC family response regulator
MPATILVVDDDPVQRRLLSGLLSRFDYTPVTVEGGQDALDYLDSPKGKAVRIILLDLVMPDLDGMGVLERLQAKRCTLPVIVQTSQGGIDTVVSAMRAGAVDFVVKPVSPERLQVCLQNALKMERLEDTVTRIQRVQDGRMTFDDMITASPSMERVINLGQRAAKSQIPILIEGESGVGKELIARAIQGTSSRKAKAFVTVNCGAIPDNLVESLLFGHEKGAFTGASDKHVGKFQEAHNGTLFLDEVGELPAPVQVKLLRALQEGEIDPVGAKKPVKVDFRLISATNRSLLEMTQDGEFREDLYYRLNVFPIWVPPLRERREDIPALAEMFLHRFAAEEGKRHLHGIEDDVLAMLQDYDWPGNIRQLENALFRAVVLSDNDKLTRYDFPQISGLVGRPAQGRGYGQATKIPDDARNQTNGHTLASGDNEDNSTPPLSPGASSGWAGDPGKPIYGSVSLVNGDGEARTIAELEKEAILFAVEHCKGRMTEVAKQLGLGRSTLYRKMKDYDIQLTE